MEEIIAPIDRDVLKAELKKCRLVRPTNKAGNFVYDVSAHEAPNIMQEIGRLRELSFRTSGGGTGKSVDIDEFDIMEKPYRQLIVWDPDNEEIVGGYRYLHGKDTVLNQKKQPNIVSSHMFHFSEEFINSYMSITTELGRAFIQPAYQCREAGIKALFALDNLWDGLGALILDNDIKYLIGKVTIYREYNETVRELLYAYLDRYFPNKQNLVNIILPFSKKEEITLKAEELFANLNLHEAYKVLQREARELGECIPALFNAYIGLTDSMQTFGTGVNDEFGDVLETGIMIKTEDILEEKQDRYIGSYKSYLETLK